MEKEEDEDEPWIFLKACEMVLGFGNIEAQFRF